MKKIFSVILVLTMIVSFAMAQPKIKLVSKVAEKKVDVLIGGKLFTSYIYPDNIKKPVLWPVITAGGNEITRQFPLKNKAGERADHPHHVGIWLNYGDVNGLDFWNNSEAISPEKAEELLIDSRNTINKSSKKQIDRLFIQFIISIKLHFTFIKLKQHT